MSKDLRDELVNGVESIYPKSADAREDAKEKVEHAEMVVLTDGDADGILAAGLVDYVFDTMDVEIFPVGPHKPILWMKQMLKILEEHGRDGMTVFFLDISLSGSPEWAIKTLEDLRMNIQFFDHHLWPDRSRYDYVDEYTNQFEVDPVMDDTRQWVIGEETVDERCTTQMVYDYFTRNGVEFPGEIKDRVQAVACGDLWLREDDGFLHDDTELLIDSIEYITDIPLRDRAGDEWYGYKEWVDSVLSVETPLEETILREHAMSYQEKIDELIDFLFENSEEFMSYKTVGDVELVAIYGDVPPNDISEKLRTEGYDGIAFINPSQRVSFRGTEKFDVCHEIADYLGGGGHEMAAGAGLDELVGEMDEDEYRASHGEEVRERLLDLMADYVED